MTSISCLECGSSFPVEDLEHGICDRCWVALRRAWSRIDEVVDGWGL